MTKKYIVIVNEEFTAKEKDSITHYFQQKEMNIWHWISNIWLLIDEKNTPKKQIRDDLLNRLNKKGSVLIFEISDPTSCTGFISPTQSKWILENWINEEPRF